MWRWHHRSGEQCDDENDVNTDACTNACRFAECGDMITGPNEECDDGNAVDSDLCTNQCRDARCGDRIVSEIAGETCDDGNVIGDDGCSGICELEGDWGTDKSTMVRRATTPTSTMPMAVTPCAV